MEKKEAEKTEVKPQKKRRVSLFKRRKKAEIRPFVKERKHREFKKFFYRIIIVVILAFILSAILYAIKEYIIPRMFYRNMQIVSPQTNVPPSNNDIKKIIEANGDISQVNFSTTSATVSFIIHGSTNVYLSSEKDIRQQIELVNAIDRQVTTDGKQAIYIDLRYNKPIVKY